MDGQPLPAIEAMIESLKRTQDKPIEITVLRDGQTLTFRLQPVLSDTDEAIRRYRVGFWSAPIEGGPSCLSRRRFAGRWRRTRRSRC